MVSEAVTQLLDIVACIRQRGVPGIEQRSDAPLPSAGQQLLPGSEVLCADVFARQDPVAKVAPLPEGPVEGDGRVDAHGAEDPLGPRRHGARVQEVEGRAELAGEGVGESAPLGVHAPDQTLGPAVVEDGLDQRPRGCGLQKKHTNKWSWITFIIGLVKSKKV